MKNLNSSNKSFGIVFSIFFIIIFFYNLIKNHSLNFYVLSLSCSFLVFAYYKPNIFGPFNKVWVKFGELLGKIVAPMVMFIVYFSVIFMTSLLLKIFKKDILKLKINKKAKTFWQHKDQKVGNMNKQY